MWRIVFIPLFVILLLLVINYLNKRREKRGIQKMQKLFEDELSRNPRLTEDQS
jgi:hypothetical protein